MIRRSLENVYVKLKSLNKGESECDQFNKHFYSNALQTLETSTELQRMNTSVHPPF